MGETASKDEAAAHGDLVRLLAEAAAAPPGAPVDLTASLRGALGARLDGWLTTRVAARLADAGALVVQQWHEVASALPAAGGKGVGKKGKPARKTVAGKARKGAKTAVGGDPPAPAGPDAAADPLFAPYAEQASKVMLELLRERTVRDEPHGPAAWSLAALEALERLEPPLARVARLRWLAGLDVPAVARLLGDDEPEVQRRWLKARAFLAVAARGGDGFSR